MSGKTVLLLGSFAPSLVHFRGPLIAAIVERGHKVVAAAPSISPDLAENLRQLGAESRQQECWPYAQPFQAGQPLSLTSSCNSASRWTALSTNMAPPAQVGAGERGR